MSETLKLYRNGFYAMATRFYTLIPGLEDGAGDELFQKMKDEVNRIESRLSRFIKESEISRINQEAFQVDVETDAECFEILSACKYGWEMTDGAFDITLRPLYRNWLNASSRIRMKRSRSVVRLGCSTHLFEWAVNISPRIMK